MSTENDRMSAFLSDQVIHDAPPSMYYIPNFITSEEEKTILSKIPPSRWIALSHRRLQAHPVRLTGPSNALVTAAPLPTWLSDPIVPRIHSLGVFPLKTTTTTTSSPSSGATAAPTKTTEINHCLINEYLPGQGIFAHEDGPAYYPVVATVSLGGSLVLDVQKKKSTNENDDDDDTEIDEFPSSCRIFQEPRSLLLTTGTAYTETLHGIAETEVDENLMPSTVANWSLLADPDRLVDAGGRNVRETRVSLTFRNVLKVMNVGAKVFGKARS